MIPLIMFESVCLYDKHMLLAYTLIKLIGNIIKIIMVNLAIFRSDKGLVYGQKRPFLLIYCSNNIVYRELN